jgi:methionine-rich copper-binding protein CopC
MVTKRQAAAVLAALATVASLMGPAEAHAMLDYATPPVGGNVAVAPPILTLRFTQQLEAAFSGVDVTDAAGRRVDLGNATVPPQRPDEMQVGLKPLAAGTYTVRWHAVSVDTHRTEGSFSFTVGGG